MKFKVGDEAIVTAGKDKGKRGKVEKVFPETASVLIPNINVYKKFRRAQAGRTSQGGLIEFNRSLAVANVALLCPHCGRPTRIGQKVTNERKLRFCKKCKKELT